MEEWKELPKCPFHNSALVIIDGELTAVGGYKGSNTTKNLATMQKKKWNEAYYPPMKKAYQSPLAVCTSDGRYLVVIGWNDGFRVKMEIFEVERKTWYPVTNLKSACFTSRPSATICWDKIYVINRDKKGKSYSYFLHAPPSSDKPITPEQEPHIEELQPLPPLQVTKAIAATLHGQLIVFSGDKEIHQLVNEKWEIIDSKSSCGNTCLAVSSKDKVLLIGKETMEEVTGIIAT